MNYYLYKITNQVNGKIYVGVHKTRDMNDGYMGSGKVILAAIKKHGIENFKKDILETFADAKSMYAREKEVVTEEFLSRKDVYNLRRGGFGGFDWLNKHPDHSEWSRQGGRKGGKVSGKITGPITGPRNLKQAHLEGKIPHATFTGRRHSEETKRKMSLARQGKSSWNKGKTHSQATKDKIAATLKARISNA